MDESKLTPMMQQYRRIKAEIPADAVLLFRLGDFYEMFFDDAKRAAPVLDVVLTHRQGVLMAGVPHHALDAYLPRLLEAGLKVAIADQMEDPRQAKGIVKRAVTRIITPGTVIEGAVLDPKQSRFLTALVRRRDRFGLACLDISTGDFRVTEVDGPEALAIELHRLDAAECLLPELLHGEWTRDAGFPATVRRILWTPLDDWHFAPDAASDLLRRHFGVQTLDGFGCRDLPLGVGAAGAILHYAKENLRRDIGHIRALTTYHPGQAMVLDPATQRHLELVDPQPGGRREATLLHVLDQTATPMGGRLLREWLLRPLCDRDAILARLDAVGTFHDDPIALAELREALAGIRDLERITARLNLGSANARDLLALARGLRAVPGLKTLLAAYDLPLLGELRDRLRDRPALADEIEATLVEDPPPAVTDGGLIRPGRDERLDEFRRAATDGKGWLAALQTREQERTGIKSLKIRYNKVFGYYLEISQTNLHLVPEDYRRKQTLANAERFITPELKEMEEKILGAEDKARTLEYELFLALREQALAATADLQQTAAAIAALDVLGALAEAARRHRYRRPRLVDDPELTIRGGRHPVLDAAMQDERFVPNDTTLDGDRQRLAIITGPNMAGKSTYIRQVALLVLMAQMGSFIPADEAVIGIADRIFTRVGAADDLSRGQSTFMVEMLEAANILHHATARSLVVLDEIGRGTSTFDGISIAWAIAEHIHDHIRARTLFATHYHELTELALTRPGVRNYNVAVREYGDQIIFLRQIVPGGADKSYGIHVAKLAGLPAPIIGRAREILENLESHALGEAGVPVLAVHHPAPALAPNPPPPPSPAITPDASPNTPPHPHPAPEAAAQVAAQVAAQAAPPASPPPAPEPPAPPIQPTLFDWANP
jgi:DNA mismatch repair protein MutS